MESADDFFRSHTAEKLKQIRKLAEWQNPGKTYCAVYRLEPTRWGSVWFIKIKYDLYAHANDIK